jgi:putative ABC transport system permease protein
MISHYLTTAWRAFGRSKAYSALNILELTLGITCALIILLFVYDELTYDHNHKNIGNIYRLNSGWTSATDGTSSMYPSTDYGAGDVLKQDFPEVDQLTRFRRFWDVRIEKPGTDDYLLEYVFAADSNLFKIFTFPFVAGSPETALAEPNSLVISRSTALKYFNREDVLGETLRWLGQDTLVMKITGVMEDHPGNTHFKINLITRLVPPPDVRADWFEYRYHTYFTLKPNTDPQAVEAKIRHFTKPYVAEVEKEIGFIHENSIIPFSKIHLYSKLAGELETNGNAGYVYIFLVIGIFIVVMACINFMNLATARSMKRAKEIGIRKVVGAIRSQLIRQFLGEAFLMTVLAAAASIVLAYFLLPFVNEFSGKDLGLFTNSIFWAMLGVIIIFVGFLAGAYPSFILAAFRPVETLKGSFRSSHGGSYLRKLLVVFQFSISIILIAGTLIITSHLKFLRQKELGFSKENVLVVTGASRSMKDQLMNISGVTQTTFSNKVPGLSVGGRTIVNGWDKTDQQVVLGQLAVDYDFIDLYNLKLLEGRAFDRNFPSDLKEAFLVNESAMKRLGIQNAKDAIGHELWLEDWGGRKGKIIGVLKDFHFIGVNAAIEPFSMFLHNDANRHLSVKINSADLRGTVKQIEEMFHAAVPGRPFEYFFMDQSFDRQYQAEDRFMTIFSFFASIAILIGCLGLYGLALFMAEQRTKEIGVRKVLGASEKSILILLTSDFLKLVTLAFVIAIPIAYWSMDKWLSTFPYREKISPVLFVFTGLSVLAITVFTVSFQAMRAAMTSPVKTLRTE